MQSFCSLHDTFPSSLSDPSCQLADTHTFQTVHVIYIIVATGSQYFYTLHAALIRMLMIIARFTVFIIGSVVSIFLIMRQRRKRREQQQQMGKLPEPSNAPTYNYDPSVGRPVQNVWPGNAPPPTYSQV
ncbi:hypothetical protein BJ912DRAFT_587203 [Pholiota molesta]|nr:hypothetical protein BJ912DRAFT_587203 [Pholiota molesta]